jgi:hypothetical protein
MLCWCGDDRLDHSFQPLSCPDDYCVVCIRCVVDCSCAGGQEADNRFIRAKNVPCLDSPNGKKSGRALRPEKLGRGGKGTQNGNTLN